MIAEQGRLPEKLYLRDLREIPLTIIDVISDFTHHEFLLLPGNSNILSLCKVLRAACPVMSLLYGSF